MTKPTKQFRLPRHVNLRKIAPLLLVLGMVGIGLGPGREKITQWVNSVQHKVAASPHVVNPVEARVSSQLSEHPGSAAIDTSSVTYWQSEGNGIGQSITVLFASPVTVDYIGLISGIGGKDSVAQARPEVVRISSGTRKFGTVTFADTANFQSERVHVHGVQSLTLTIVSDYAGQVNQDVAIRSVQFDRLG